MHKKISFILAIMVLLAVNELYAQQRDSHSYKRPHRSSVQYIEKEEVYYGYSKTLLPVKSLLVSGRFGDAIKTLWEEKTIMHPPQCQKRARAYEELKLLERGMLAGDGGDFEQAIECFACAEHFFAQQEMGSVLGGFFNDIVDITLGKSPYWGEGYEKVLMLNYKSIAYLLQGERKAYNVTRRAINWQNIERKRFEKKIKKAKQELAKKEREQSEKAPGIFTTIFEQITGVVAPFEKKATSLPSAFVNPFGNYLAGIVQEFESFEDTSLRANARISYEKALDLNPGSKVLKQAVADLKKPCSPDGKRLVHVVAGMGFAPEKILFILPVFIEKKLYVTKLSIYKPVPCNVHRIEVYDASNNKLASLSLVSDVEAIILRHQMDMVPSFYVDLLGNILGEYIANKIIKSNETVEERNLREWKQRYICAQHTRSWICLPASIQAARFYVPKDLKKIKITTCDKKGRRLAAKTVNLDTSSHNFVYVRSIDKTLYAHANQKMWLVIN